MRRFSLAHSILPLLKWNSPVPGRPIGPPCGVYNTPRSPTSRIRPTISLLFPKKRALELCGLLGGKARVLERHDELVGELTPGGRKRTDHSDAREGDAHVSLDHGAETEPFDAPAERPGTRLHRLELVLRHGHAVRLPRLSAKQPRDGKEVAVNGEAGCGQVVLPAFTCRCRLVARRTRWAAWPVAWLHVAASGRHSARLTRPPVFQGAPDGRGRAPPGQERSGRSRVGLRASPTSPSR